MVVWFFIYFWFRGERVGGGRKDGYMFRFFVFEFDSVFIWICILYLFLYFIKWICIIFISSIELLEWSMYIGWYL